MNRSLPAYLNNPEAERARYANDTDKEMTLLKFEREDGAVGALNWFAVHPTSLTFDNTLVWGDHNAFRQGLQYVEIQRLVGSDWATVVTESDWSTKIRWIQPGRPPPAAPLDPFVPPAPPINDPFDVTITWEIPDDVEAGTYRVLFNGSEKQEGGDEPLLFTAQSPSFEVMRPTQ